MVKRMIKSFKNKTKCAPVDASDDYRILSDNLANPYCYNFGRIERNGCVRDFQRLQNRVNMDYFNKR